MRARISTIGLATGCHGSARGGERASAVLVERRELPRRVTRLPSKAGDTVKAALASPYSK